MQTLPKIKKTKLDQEQPFIADSRHADANEFGISSSVAKRLSIKDAKQFGASIRTLNQVGAADLEEANTSLEAVIERSNFLPAWFGKIADRRQMAVCLISAEGIDYQGNAGSWVGTGFLVAPDVLLTNNHVLNSYEVAERSSVMFNYQKDEKNNDVPTVEFKLRPDHLFVTHPAAGGLDFTFVGVEGNPGKQFGHIELFRDFFSIANKEFCNIIQHPGGEQKSIVLQENEVQDQTEVVVRYTSDTMPGSSGSPVFNNEWRLTALHHASKKISLEGGKQKVLNEGIKVSAIATILEELAKVGDQSINAKKALKLFKGSNSITGFFGAMGRTASGSGSVEERVVNSYKGEDEDIDVGFWNIEHFQTRWTDKLARVADVIVDLNLDIWALEEVSPQSVEQLCKYLNNKYEMKFGFLMSEPDASNGRQTTGILFNEKTVNCRVEPWPDKVQGWFRKRSTDRLDDLEAVDGKIFDRYPERFHVENKDSSIDLSFYIVPLHLKAMSEGSKRRRLASEILSAAIAFVDSEDDVSHNWILGGDMNASLRSKDFKWLEDTGMVPVSAKDEKDGAITYIKGPKSIIDHVFLSANLAGDTDPNFFVVARDKEIPGYIEEISDHRPVLVRLSSSTRRGGGRASTTTFDDIDSEMRSLMEKRRLKGLVVDRPEEEEDEDKPGRKGRGNRPRN